MEVQVCDREMASRSIRKRRNKRKRPVRFAGVKVKDVYKVVCIPLRPHDINSFDSRDERRGQISVGLDTEAEKILAILGSCQWLVNGG